MPVNRFNHTSLVAVVTHMTVLSRFAMVVLSKFLCCHVAFLDFSGGVGAFVIGRSQISFFFS